MDDAKLEFDSAVEMARTARAAWMENANPATFRIWRDASEIAIKWHRACRLGGAETDSFDEGLRELLQKG